MKLYEIIKKAMNINASSPSGGGGAINRDPKVLKVKRDGFQINDSGGGRDNFEELEVDLEVIDNAIAADSYMMMSMMRHSELVTKAGYFLKSVNEQALEYLELRLDFMEAATGIKTSTLIQQIIDDLVRYSNAIFIKARSKSGEGLPPGAPIQPILPANAPIGGYFRVHPKTITIARDEYGEVLKYKQEIDGEEKEYKPEDVVHFTINKPSGKTFGYPWVYPVLEDIRLLRKIEENVAILIYKHIYPLLKYQVGMNKEGLEATDEEIEKVRNEMENLPVDGMIVMPERHNIESLKLEPIEVEKYLEHFENRVFSGLGMSQIDMGRGDTANRNTADSMDSQKLDRIKGWQRQIEVQIDQYIIDELLIEGGYDPLINKEFDVDFVFEEIENEKRMALENHTINKFNNNLLSYEEARLEIGEDINIDEGRLHFNMFGSSGEDGSVSNASQPENQHGKRDAPKDSKEFVLSESENEKSYSGFIMEFDTFSSDAFSQMKNLLEVKEEFTLVSEINKKSIMSSIENNLLQTSNLKNKNQIREYASDWVEKILAAYEGVFKTLKEDSSLIRMNIEKERILNRAKQFDEYVSQKIESLSYIESVMEEGGVLVVEAETDCPTCSKYNGYTFDESTMHEIEKKIIYYNAPPYHSNCECKLKRKE